MTGIWNDVLISPDGDNILDIGPTSRYNFDGFSTQGLGPKN
jgi:hypothetical protein